MKMKLGYLLLFLLVGPWVQGQVKIGDNPQNLDSASILELESTSRALVISRVTTAQMNAIAPLRGAMVYNTDADCLYYYNGSNWINLCEASGGPFTFTTDPVVNPISTIMITRTGNNYNFEVGEITSNNIVDGSINGFSDIQDGTISSSKLQDRAVGPSKLEEGAVSSFEIENESILTVDIAPEGPDRILATNSNGEVQWQNKSSLAMVTDPTTITGAGTATDPLKVSDDITMAIANNTTDIAAHIAADGDIDPANEIQTLAQVLAQDAAANGRITDLTDPIAAQDAATRAYVDNAVGGVGQIVVSGNAGNLIGPGTDGGALLNTVDDADADPENEIQDLILTGGNQLSLTGSSVTVNLPTSSGADTYIQGGTNINLSGTGINTDPYIINNTYTEGDGDATNELITDVVLTGTTLTITEAGVDHEVDLSELGGGGSQDLSSVLGIGNDAGGVKITGIATPTLDTDAATKKYVDDAVVAAGGGVATDELQDIQLTGTTLSLTTPATLGNNVDLDLTFTTDTELAAFNINDADADPLNEIQSITSNDLSVTITPSPTGNDFDLSVPGSTDSQDISTDGTAGNISIANGSTIALNVDDADADPLNEIQSITSNDLSVTITPSLTGNDFDLSVPISTLWDGITLDVPGDINTTGDINAGGDITSGGVSVVPDYVFETYFTGSSNLSKEYKFKTLAEIEAFVRENHHLPGILSAEEVKASGQWNLTQASVNNLEKIEELYLHTIEQQKEIERLKADRDSLSQEVKAIKREMEGIKVMLKNRNKE